MAKLPYEDMVDKVTGSSDEFTKTRSQDAAAVNTNKWLVNNQNPLDSIYKVDGTSWYKVFPYVFAIETVGEPDPQYFKYALTIPPESLVTQMIVANEAVPTLGGVVEEPSPNVFWSIQMAGTTGIAPSRTKNSSDSRSELGQLVDMASSYRSTIGKTGMLTGMVQNLLKPLDAIGNMAQAFQEDGVLSGLQSVVQPMLPYNRSAVDANSNGYTEIHNLHKFFIFYSYLNSRKDAENNAVVGNNADLKTKKYGLFFYNYKDNQKFRIVLKNFVMMKSHNSPHLYRYQIQFKGWSLMSATDNQASMAKDRFGKDGDLKTVNTLSVTSYVTGAKNLIRKFNSAKTDPLGTFLGTPPVV